MEQVYKGRYFNGKTATPHTVDVVWYEHGFEIRFSSPATPSMLWEKSGIQQTELSSAIVTLRYGDTFPQQQLEVTDVDFIARYKKEFGVHVLHKVRYTSAKVLISLLLALAGAVWLSYLYVLPLLADYTAQAFPRDYEIKMGQQIYESVLEGEDIDTAKTEAINQFFHQLKVPQDYPVKITVVKSPVVNAFALPGGGIVVYDGILKDMKSADQLAALLSHEFSHVQLKHATRNLFRSLAGYLFVSILFSDVNGVASVVVDNANQLRNLSYSRELETEADNHGLQLLKENKISAAGMKALFEQLKKESGGIEVSEIISTHPDLDNRIKNAEQFMRENKYGLSFNDSLVFYFAQLKTDSTSSHE